MRADPSPGKADASSVHSVSHVALDPADRKRVVRWLSVVIVASLVLGIAWDALFGQVFSLRPAAIGDWLEGTGPWAPIIYIGAMIGAIIFSPIPSVPLDIAAGLAFGLVRGTIYTLIGAEIGAIIAFLIARRFGRPRLAARLSPGVMRHIDDLSGRVGFKALVIMRLLPVFNFDWVSYAAGLTAISLPRFAVATLAGMTPPVIAITAVGSTYSDTPVLSLSILVVLVLLATIPLVVALRSETRRQETSPPRGGA